MSVMKKQGGRNVPRKPGRQGQRPGGSTSRPTQRAQPGARRRGSGRPGRDGPSRGGPGTCPMCGAVVTDLGGHVRAKHDDPASHPRD